MGISPENHPGTNELSPKAKSLLSTYGNETTFISRLFTRLLAEWRPKNLLKIAIQIVDSKEKEKIVPSNRFTKACAIYTYFEFTPLHNEQNQTSRYKILLDLMLSALTKGSEEFGWPIEVFNATYSKIMNSNFINEYSLLAPKMSPDKRHSAFMVASIERDWSTIFLEIKDKFAQIKKVEVIKLAQHKDDFSIAKNIKWIDNKDLVISNQDNEINVRYTLFNESIEIFLTPNIHNEDYLQDELKLLSPDTSKEESIEIINRRINEIKRK